MPNLNQLPNFDRIKEEKIENITFDKIDSILKFELNQYTYKPKIERYIQRNYKKIPIYSNTPSISKKRILLFNKKIDVIKFCNDLYKKFPELNIDQKRYICDYLNQKPEWIKLIDNIHIHEKEIETLKTQYRIYEKEKPALILNNNHYKDKPSIIWIRVLLTPFTLGLSWIGFISKKRAEANAKLNAKIAHENAIEKKNYIDYCENLKKVIEDNNSLIYSNIITENKKIEDLCFKLNNLDDINNYKNTENWFDLRKVLYSSNKEFLRNKKGVYIIWNQTKNKHYVGQTKDLYNRIFQQHFCNNDVKNIKFAKDWYSNDIFYFQWFECDTKDELDEKEKYYIDYYNSFKYGYNKTNGNK